MKGEKSKQIKRSRLKNNFSRLKNFIQYNNAFSIILMIIFLGFSVAFAASPDLRGDVLSSKEVVKSVDNSYILSMDLDNFNFNFQIKDITEDAENYYVAYTYITIAIRDYVWQEMAKEKIIDFSKIEFINKDFGLYVAEQLGQNMDHEMSYLKEVQQIERKNGITQKVITTEYAGLIGAFFDPKEKVFPGYQPVIPPEQENIQIAQSPIVQQEEIQANAGQNQEPPIAIGSIDKESLRKMIEELLKQKQSEGYQPQQSQSEEIPAEEPADEPTSNENPTEEQPIEETPAIEQTPVVEQPIEEQSSVVPPADNTQPVTGETPVQ